MNSAPVSRGSLLRLAALALCAAPVMVVLQRGQIARPMQTTAERPREKTEADRFSANHPDSFTEAEWEETISFLKQHSPNRFATLGKAPHENLKRTLIARYRSIAQIKDQKQLYEIRVQSLEVEDEIFGLCLDIKKGKGDHQRKQSELKAKTRMMVDLSLKERGQRIDLLEKALVDQKKVLDTDKNERERLVNERYQYFLTHGVMGARMEGSPKHPRSKSGEGSSTTPSPGEPE